MEGLDGYDLKARLSPGFLAVGPLALALVVLVGEHLDLIKVVTSLALAIGIPFLVASSVRDRGKALEPDLWRSWGGAPTTRMLRAAEDDHDTVDRRQLAQHLTGLDLPTAQTQLEDPVGSDRQIEKVVAELIKHTQSDPVVQSELAEYGMRRNMLGIRTIGLLVGWLTVGIGIGDLAWSLASHEGSTLASAFTLSIGSLAALGWSRVTPSWVRPAAERYAEALLR